MLPGGPWGVLDVLFGLGPGGPTTKCCCCGCGCCWAWGGNCMRACCGARPESTWLIPVGKHHLQNFHAYRHNIFRHAHSHKKHLSALQYPFVKLSTHQRSSQWTNFCEILYRGHRKAHCAWRCPPYACPTTPHVCKTRGCQCSFRLPMMGGVSPETCWASYKYGRIKFWYVVASCWIFFLNYTTMHRSTNIR